MWILMMDVRQSGEQEYPRTLILKKRISLSSGHTSLVARWRDQIEC